MQRALKSDAHNKNNRRWICCLVIFLNHKRGQIDIICRSAWWKCQNEQRWLAFSDFRNRMWNLARSWNPLFFSRSNESRDTLRMLTRETVGLRWRPFAFWFLKKKWEVNEFSWVIWCMFCVWDSNRANSGEKTDHHKLEMSLIGGWLWFSVENKLFVWRRHSFCVCGGKCSKLNGRGQYWTDLLVFTSLGQQSISNSTWFIARGMQCHKNTFEGKHKNTKATCLAEYALCIFPKFKDLTRNPVQGRDLLGKTCQNRKTRPCHSCHRLHDVSKWIS